MAVDMVHGEEIPLSDGPLLPAILASSAVPGAFPPVKHQGRQLADGGVIAAGVNAELDELRRKYLPIYIVEKSA